MLDQDDIPTKGEPKTTAVVRRAHTRWKKAQKWESESRTNWLADEKFANGDSYNQWQWPDAIYETRGNRPTLTVNEVRQHNLHIINEAKQNKTSVKYRPTGDGATEEASEVWEGIYRHIANISNAQMAQGVAIGYQVRAGLGFTRIVSEYSGAESFDQEIYIRAVPNPLACYLDPDSVEPDGSDARYAFIFADRPRDEVEEEYPELKGSAPPTNAVDGEDGGWLREDHIRVAEYYEVVETKDELLGDDDGNTIMRSEVPSALVKQWEDEAEAKGSTLRRREVVRKSVKWYKIAGDLVVDQTDVPGTSVPIIPWIGEMTVIDQRLDRKGHTRALISAQQMLNYNWSASVEFGALQSKTPWIAPAQAIEGYETYWQTANTENHSILPYNHVNEDGTEIPAPARQQPPTGAPVYMEGAQIADQFMKSASGQQEAELGQQGNERSGKAINERQRQADRATYHFVDNQALSIRRQGQIILEWVPHIYDTQRVLKIIGEDGDESQVQLDPNSEQAHMMQGAQMIFNPSVGKYEVVSDVGPDYATQRQEAFNAIVQILTQAPELINKIGDLLFKVADFPLADQIAERMKPGMPPEAQQAIQALQEQLQGKNKLVAETMQALTEERIKAKTRDNDNAIKAFDADTRRLGVVKDMLPLDPTDMQAMIHQVVQQNLQDNLGPIVMHLVASLRDDNNPASASGALPVNVPNVGQQAATPGGM